MKRSLSKTQLRYRVWLTHVSIRNMSRRDPGSPQLPAMRNQLEELRASLKQAKQRKAGWFGKFFLAMCRNAGYPTPRDS